MAICPLCNATIGQTDVRCDSCGYDFTDEQPQASKTRFAYSGIADAALIVGGLAAAVGCLATIFGGIAALFEKQYLNAFFYAPLGFFLCFAMLVVFIRIQDD